MTKVYRIKKIIVTEVDGEAVSGQGFKSVNRAKKANRGNCTAPVMKPKFSPGFLLENVG